MTKEKLKYKQMIINCPIHGLIIFYSPFLIALVDTPEFQRLRQISQLGWTRLLYPSATHTRFSHSLGAYEIMRKILYEYVQNDFSERNRELLLSAALLHDVGHGPSSHVFEEIIKEHHEYYSIAIIEDVNTNIGRILKNRDKSFAQEVAQILKKEHPNPLFNDLISSALDVDRLDYLLRDSFFTGTQYGKFDLSWILRSLVFLPIKDTKKYELGIRANAISTVEQYLFARYFAYRQIYFNSKVLAYGCHFTNIWKRFFDLQKSDYQFKKSYKNIIELLSNSKNHHSMLAIDDNVINNAMQDFQYEEDHILKTLAEQFLNHRLFKAIVFSKKELKTAKKNFKHNFNYFVDSTKKTINIAKKEELKKIKVIDNDQKIMSFDKVSLMSNAFQKNIVLHYIFTAFQ